MIIYTIPVKLVIQLTSFGLCVFGGPTGKVIENFKEDNHLINL
jgi:hypothetical protein